MIERDLCLRKTIDEWSGVAAWKMSQILRSKKQPTSWYERGFLSGKNKWKEMESPHEQETNWRVVVDMTKDKAIKDPNDNQKCWICQLNREMRKMKEWWEMRIWMSLKRQEQKNSVLDNGAKKCCRTDWHDNAQTGGLSLWSPISPFKPVSRG